MTNEAFNKAQELFNEISLYESKIRELKNIINISSASAYANGELYVEIGNGGIRKSSAYIDSQVIADMASSQIEHFIKLIDKCKAEIESL